MISTIDGDLLYADTDMIVQQCNCLTKSAHGLSESIKQVLNVDPYGHRKLIKGRRNCAIREDQGIPGTAVLYDRGLTVKNPRYVACMMAQFTPGKPGKFHQDQLQLDPTSGAVITDSYKQRLAWFEACLENMVDQIETISLDPTLKKQSSEKITIAFPYLIGCGLAGGKWEDYLQIIEKWALTNKEKVSVLIIRKI